MATPAALQWNILNFYLREPRLPTPAALQWNILLEKNKSPGYSRRFAMEHPVGGKTSESRFAMEH